MFPPFSQEEARGECLSMLRQIADGVLAVVPCSPGRMTQRTQGLMLGALVCRAGDGSRIVLRTLSGISRRLCYADGYAPDSSAVLVPPVVSQSQIDAALEKNDALIHSLTDDIARARKDGDSALCGKLKAERKALTEESLLNVYGLYSFCCADKVTRSLLSICGGSLPPTGTGDCCAPKLLHYAFSHDLLPVSMCEVFYAGSGGGAAQDAVAVPPCDDRCARILPAMLGLEIVYRDRSIVVVSKQGGLLSVPGRGADKQDCVVSRLQRLFPSCIAQPAVHRLDMETSGLMVLALTKEAHRLLSAQFEQGKVSKEYEALLDGVLHKKGIPGRGTKELYFRLDVENRPHQIWDETYGKKAVTDWQVLRVERYAAPDGTCRHATRVRFVPHTGRTHQLRLLSADSHGFGVPIIGDSLYGTCAPGERLCLHATRLSFVHPVSGELMSFESPCPF